jgi:hypothetical protein
MMLKVNVGYKVGSVYVIHIFYMSFWLGFKFSTTFLLVID